MIQNLQENEVYNIVNNLLEDKKVKQTYPAVDDELKLDIICYILNRLSPHYTNSNRGYNYYLSKDINRQNRTDIISLFFSALESFKERRDTGIPLGETKTEKRYFNFPQFFGLVFNSDNMLRIERAVATFFIDGKLVDNNEYHGIQNPYTIHPQTRGIYSFWIPAIENSKNVAERTFTIKVRIEIPGSEKEISVFEKITLKSTDAFQPNVEKGNTHQLPDAFL